MASRALSALAVLGALGGAAAVPTPGGTQYSYVNGGQDWGELAGNAKCSSGTNQSPINIADQVVSFAAPALKALNLSYGASDTWTLEVTANYLEIADINTATSGEDLSTADTFTDGLTLADGTFVPLNQFHFHTPSEHTINGMHFPLEMHMVHKLYTSDGTLTGTPIAPTSNATQMAKAAVIGIMFAYSADGTNQPFMTKLQSAFAALAANGDLGDDDTFATNVTTSANQFALMTDVFGSNLVGNTDYFNYQGSLTTPGCGEGIDWFVMRKPMTASPAQILALTSALAVEQGGMSRGADNRLVQPLNNRTILASFAAPPSTTVTGVFSLQGVTKAAFTTAKQTAFINTVATQASVQASAVTITSITEVSSARRHLLAVTGLDVAFSVVVPSTAASTVTSLLQASANDPNSAFVASMMTATGATGVTISDAPPATTSAAPSVASAVAAAVAAAALALAF